MIFCCGFHTGETPLGTIFFLSLFRPWSALSSLTWCHQPAACRRTGLSFAARLTCRTAASRDKITALALRSRSIQGNVLWPIRWCSTGEQKTSAVSSSLSSLGDCAQPCWIFHRTRIVINWNLNQLLEKFLQPGIKQIIFLREQQSPLVKHEGERGNLKGEGGSTKCSSYISSGDHKREKHPPKGNCGISQTSTGCWFLLVQWRNLLEIIKLIYLVK